jgi:hypothetical protein
MTLWSSEQHDRGDSDLRDYLDVFQRSQQQIMLSYSAPPHFCHLSEESGKNLRNIWK